MAAAPTDEELCTLVPADIDGSAGHRLTARGRVWRGQRYDARHGEPDQSLVEVLQGQAQHEFNERADPKVQLEQAIAEAQDQHRRLKEQAANVIANQKQTEMQLNRAMADLERHQRLKARQAVLMADDATQAGRHRQGHRVHQGGRGLRRPAHPDRKAGRSLKTLSLQSTQAADQAKAAVQQNSSLLQQKLAERQKLLSQFDQAKMQEQMNRAMASLSETVGQDVPTLEEVRDKIEVALARALGTAEIQGQTVESRMLEVEQASMDVEAQKPARAIKAQLGLAAPAAPGVGAARQAACRLNAAAAHEVASDGESMAPGRHRTEETPG